MSVTGTRGGAGMGVWAVAGAILLPSQTPSGLTKPSSAIVNAILQKNRLVLGVPGETMTMMTATTATATNTFENFCILIQLRKHIPQFAAASNFFSAGVQTWNWRSYSFL